MSEQAFFWIAGIFAVIVAAIGGALWRHIVEDAKVRERLATLESDNTTNKNEIKSIRDRWHDLREHTLNDIWSLFRERLESLNTRFEALKSELLRLVGK